MHFSLPGPLASALAAVALLASPANPSLAASPPSGATFLNRVSSTDSPSLQVDAAGGMHLAFAGYYTGINPTDDPRQPGFYAYCAPGADCSTAGGWAQVSLGAHVQTAQLALTPAGQPRVLFETADSATGMTASYWFGACDAGCVDPANWSLIDLVDTGAIIGDVWSQPNHSFALDQQGRPRLLYGASGQIVYATCDAACTGPANWTLSTLGNGLYLSQSALAFTSAGLPRAVGFVYNPSDFSFKVDYLECNAGCGDGANWSLTTLQPEGQAPLSASLRVDGADRVGVALSQSQQLWYWQCGAGCADGANWLWTRWDGLSGSVQDADLAFDAQNRPHLALRSSGGPFGWGLAQMACTANCTSPDAAWTGGLVEDAVRLGQDLALPIPANCSIGTWFGDFRPSLALDPQGNLRVAFDNEFWISGCTDSTRIRTEFKAVRVLYAGPAAVAGQALVAGPGAAVYGAPASLAPSHGVGPMAGRHVSRLGGRSGGEHAGAVRPPRRHGEGRR